MTDAQCPFCDLTGRPVLAFNERAVAFPDANPIKPGHTLIVPRRHVAGYFELDRAEIEAMHELLHQVRRHLVAVDPAIAGFNVGVNDGAVAGQSVAHVNLHVVPRHAGDVAEPRGGFRRFWPEPQPYLGPQPSREPQPA
jgi:ATP adenylyltransferase